MDEIQHAAVTYASAILIAVGGVFVPAGLPWEVGVVAGACGLAGTILNEVFHLKAHAAQAPATP